MATTTHYQVDGMKCQHCVNSATTVLEALDGYQSSEIDLAAGTLALSGDIDAALVCSTLTAAGYPTRLSDA
jgi:copper chaperone CopZ